MDMETYVAHLNREEIRLFLPIRVWLCRFLVAPTAKRYEEFLKMFVDCDEWTDYVPMACIVNPDEFQRFAYYMMNRLRNY